MQCFFAGVGAVVFIANCSGSYFFLIPDPTPLALIAFAFAGRSLSSLRSKLGNRGYYSIREKSKEDYKRELQWGLAFLTIGVTVQAYSRKIEIRPTQSISDTIDNNACANFGGCPSGPEQLPEFSAYSILAGTRFFTELKASGAIWNPSKELDPNITALRNPSCDYKSLTLPMIVKSRFRVPKNKLWWYDSQALEIQCTEFHISDSPEKEFNSSFTFQAHSSKEVKVNIGNSYMKYSMCVRKGTIQQIYREIELKVKNRKRYCFEDLSRFRCYSIEFNDIIQQALRRKFLRRTLISYWKVLVACILWEFGEEHATNIHNLKIRQQTNFYLNNVGEFLTFHFLLLAVVGILVGELDEREICIDIFQKAWGYTN